MKQIVVIGGGFAGMWAALTAAREVDNHRDQIHVTLVTRDEYLTVRPRLYEVFSETLRAPLTPTLAPLGIDLKIGSAQSIDVKRKVVTVLGAGENALLPYDRLVVAAGSEQNPLDIPGLGFSWNVDSFAAARSFDQHLQRTLRAPDRPGRLTFVIVGGGFTGIELVAEMRRRIQVHSDVETADKAKLILLERENVVGPDLGANPRPVIESALKDARVETRLGTRIAEIEQDAIVLIGGERIATSTVVVTAGLRAHPIAAQLGAELDRQGRVIVDSMLRVNGADGVFCAGDVAHAMTDDSHVALMSCQHAVPMGKHAGYNAAHALLGSPLRAYSQPNYVTCLDLGESGAMLTIGWDRAVEKAGAEVKQLKRMINTQWIYPPTGARNAILAAADLDAPWPPPT